MPRVVGREQNLCINLITKQIFDRIAILNTVQPADNHVTGIRIFGINSKYGFFDPLLDRCLLLGRWLIHISWRHQVMT